MATKHIFSYSFFHEYLAPWALPTLLQVYDPFQDQQLLPTLKEYNFVLNIKVINWMPFVNIPEVFNLEAITEALYLSLDNLKGNWKHKCGVFGFSSRFLTTKAKEFASERNWLAFNVVVATLVYGIFMFPNNTNFVDRAVVYLFMDENPMLNLLDDTHHSIHSEYGMKGIIVCCLPLLNKWFISHISVGGLFVDFRGTYSFSQRITSLTHHDIKWHNPEMNIFEFITSCGEFSNIPLIGIKGCINYNLIVALHQLGYAMNGEPFDRDVENSLFFDKVANPGLMKKLQLAWAEIHRKYEALLGRKDANVGIPYTRWVM